MQAFDVAHRGTVDGPPHDHVKGILAALGHNCAGLESPAVGVVPVPGPDLLLGNVGVSQQIAGRTHGENDGIGRFGVGHVHHVEPVEQVRRAQGQVPGDVAPACQE